MSLIANRSRRRPGMRSTALLLAAFTIFAAAAPVPVASAQENASSHLRLADQLLSVTDMPGYQPTGNHVLPTSEIIPGRGLFVETIRRESLVAAHERAFASFDGATLVRLRLAEAVNAGFAAEVGQMREAKAESGFDAPRLIVSQEQTTEGGDRHTVRTVRGRTAFELVLISSPTSSNPDRTTAMSTVRKIANKQYAKMIDSADLTDRTSISLTALQLQLYFSVLSTLLIVQLFFWLAVSLADGTTREHVIRRWNRPRPGADDPRVRINDISTEAGKRSKAHRVGVVLRGAVFLALFTAVFPLGWLDQFVLFGVTGFAFSLFEVVRDRRSDPHRFRAVYGIRSSLIVVLGSTLGIALAGLGLESIFSSALPQFVMPAEISAEGADKLAELALFLGVLLLAVADVPYRFGRRIAARDVKRMLNEDQRPELLLLRSFMDEGLRLRARRTERQSALERLVLRRRERFEELVAWSLWRIGPVVAAGEPGTKLPPLGAAREDYGEEEWQQKMTDKIDTSRFIVFIVGRSRWLGWEIDRVREKQALHRAIFVFPPVPRAELRTRLTVLAARLGVDEAIFPPQDISHPGLLVLRFDVDGTPCLTVSDARNDISYLLAVGQAADEVTRSERVPLSKPGHAVCAPAQPVDHLLVTSPKSKDVRVARWKRRAITWPWIASVTISFLGSVLLTMGPTETPLPPSPGAVVSHTRMDWTVAIGGDRFIGADRARRQLVDLKGDQATMLHEFTEVPHLLEVSDATVFATTFKPYHLIALRSDGAGYREVWRTDLPAKAFALTVLDERVAVTLPSVDQVVTIDGRTGSNKVTTSVEGGPWSVVAHRHHLLVGSLNTKTVTWLEPRTSTVTKAVPAIISPGTLRVSGDVLFMGSIADSAIVRQSLTDDRVLGRTDVERFNGTMAIGPSHMLVGTYHEIPRLISLDVGTLAAVSMTEVPAEALDLSFTESAYYFTTDNRIMRIPG